MFKMFKRTAAPGPQPRRSASTPSTSSRAPTLPAEPLPLPEVVEDHDDSAWDQWEQSQFQLDSQLGGLPPSDAVRVRDPGKGPAQEPDPFAKVGKNHR